MGTIDLNKEIAQTSELVEKSNELLEKLGVLKEFENKEEIIFNKDIKKFGSCGSHIIIPQRFVGYEATLIIKKKVEGKQSK